MSDDRLKESDSEVKEERILYIHVPSQAIYNLICLDVVVDVDVLAMLESGNILNQFRGQMRFPLPWLLIEQRVRWERQRIAFDGDYFLRGRVE